MKLDPKTLPADRRCVGCGAMMRSRHGAPGTRVTYHPAPLCEHLLTALDELGIPRPAAHEGLVFTDEKGPAPN